MLMTRGTGHEPAPLVLRSLRPRMGTMPRVKNALRNRVEILSRARCCPGALIDLRKATDQCDVDLSRRWTVDRRTSSSNGFGITSATSSNIALPEIAER